MLNVPWESPLGSPTENGAYINGEVKMYKKQLAFQKFVCLLAIFAGAATFIYSLGIMTDLYDCLYKTMMDPNNLSNTFVQGSIVYYDMQPFNKVFTYLSIALILINCVLFITNTHNRRKYYVGNYIAIGLNVCAALGLSAWAHFEIEKYKAQFLQINFEELKAFSEMWKTHYTESTFWFDLHYYIFGAVLIVAALLIINLIWKLSMMSAEKRLIAKGRKAMGKGVEA